MELVRPLLFEDTSSNPKERAKRNKDNSSIDQIKSDNKIIKIFEHIASKDSTPSDEKKKENKGS